MESENQCNLHYWGSDLSQPTSKETKIPERSPRESSTTVLEGKEPQKRVGWQLIVSDKAWLRLKRSLKAITRKTSPLSFDERIGKIKEIQRGWLNYFRGANIFTKLRDLDGWVRNRLRYCIWSRSSCGRRNLNGKGKTLSVSELKRVLPMHGVDHVWVVGPLLKARFLVLLSLSRDLRSGSMSLCSMFTLGLILHFTNRRIRDPYVRWCERRTPVI